MTDARPTILVVDDEPIVVEIVQRYLLREGMPWRPRPGDGRRATLSASRVCCAI
jgi:CheY-like chemotaxis protein